MSKHTRQFNKYKAILEQDTLTEREILNIKRLFNGYGKSAVTLEEKRELEQIMDDHINAVGGYSLTPEQTLKGINWLNNEWKTPRGVERKNNPFGYREQECLSHFDHFLFEGFYNASRVYDRQYHNYLPLWGVYSKGGNGACFQYYMARGTGYNGGNVEIVG